MAKNKESKNITDDQLLVSEIATRKLRFGGVSAFLDYLPDPDPILRRLGKDVTVYRDLLSDAHVESVVEQRKNAVKSLNWQIVRDEAGEKESDFIEEVFEEFDVDRGIDQILNAPLFGMSVIENVFKKEGSFYVIDKFEEKPLEWFGFDQDNELLFFTQDSIEGEIIIGKKAHPKHKHKWILVQNKPTYLNPFGSRALSKCYWPVAFKRGGMKFWVKMVEKYGMPFPVGKQPRGAGEKASLDMLDSLERLIQDGIAVIPDDSSVEIHESKGSASTDIYKEFRQANNDEISKAILTQTLTTEIGNKGTYAASKTHEGMLDLVALSDKKLVQTAFNKLIKSLIDINFNSGNYPVFDVYEEEDVNKELADRTKTLKDVGVKPTRKFIAEKFNLDDDDFVLEWEVDESKTSKPKNQKLDSNGVIVDEPDIDKTELSEAKNAAIKDLINDAIPDKVLQAQAEQTLKSVIEFIKNTNDFDTAKTMLSERFTKMDTSNIEQLLQKTIFIAELEGRFEAQENAVQNLYNV